MCSYYAVECYELEILHLTNVQFELCISTWMGICFPLFGGIINMSLYQYCIYFKILFSSLYRVFSFNKKKRNWKFTLKCLILHIMCHINTTNSEIWINDSRGLFYIFWYKKLLLEWDRWIWSCIMVNFMWPVPDLKSIIGRGYERH